MRPGDVFFHNDVYRSEGGIGHLPDLCVTVPGVRSGGTAWSRSCRPSATTTTSAAPCPGSMPSAATSVFEEGLMVPPIRLWDAGVPNRAALTIMTRNSRMPESLAADLDAECSACLMGARRLGELFDRYGVDTVESCFDAIIDRTTDDVPPRDPRRRSLSARWTSGRTTPSTTASTSRGCTPSGSR